ncbi:MAG: potassium transporter Trk [Thermonema sp.]|jgi:trk system potassium uptake protein TrkA|uniref:potassium channel family protein n=1 Tax=Thermonema TaxID=28194 RepID=UPI0005700B4C|nr:MULTISPECIES: TrkA family potassium uptake protein [Thermonema]GIV40202.1 MAG: potassium transporter Trk [Thermonema sp.]
MPKRKIAVIGLGQFGMEIARTLAARGAEVLALDNDMGHIEAIKDEVAYAVQIDATDKRALQAQNISEMDAVVVAIGEDFEALLLCTVNLLELQVKEIIVRSASDQQEKILRQLGVSKILSPEREVAKTVSEGLLNPDVLVRLPLPDGYEIAEVPPPPKIVNRKLADIGLREKYDLNLITIKRYYEETVEGEEQPRRVEHIIGVPTPTTMIYEGDILILMGRKPDIDKFLLLNR